MSGVEGAERAPCVYMLYCTYSAAGGGENTGLVIIYQRKRV